MERDGIRVGQKCHCTFGGDSFPQSVNSRICILQGEDKKEDAFFLPLKIESRNPPLDCDFTAQPLFPSIFIVALTFSILTTPVKFSLHTHTH